MIDHPTPQVFTIPPGVSFVDALAHGLLDRHADPLALADTTVLLPNRRAVRALREAFLKATKGAALLLPTLRPLGDLDDDTLGQLEGAATGPGTAAAALDLAPSMPDARRLFLLATQVKRFAAHQKRHISAAESARMARHLMRFMDRMEREGIPMQALDALVPADLAAHWQDTLTFLEIVTATWPLILEEAGCLNPVDRQVRLMNAFAARLADHPPIGAFYIAGSTGSQPATARLMAVVARLPAGGIVLPGLVPDLDDESWDALDETHPFWIMKQVLETLKTSRHEVQPWIGATMKSPRTERARAVIEALRPAATVAGWRGLDRDVLRHDIADGMTRLTLPGRREEAGVIACMMRDALDTPEKTAALVTPDRTLARAVASELKRWGITVNDSGGVPLLKTPPATFLTLIAEALAEDFAPVPFLALVKHPFFACGLAPGVIRRQMRGVETLALRGPRPAPGVKGILAALKARGADDTLKQALATLADLAGPLTTVFAGKALPFETLLIAHIELAQACAATDADTDGSRLWQGDAGEVLAATLRKILKESPAAGMILPTDYAALSRTLLEGDVVRPAYGSHPRLMIWGTLEARLQQPDLVILGGLNEGSWPLETTADPWMSRPMLRHVGLTTPERRIGQAAHDFLQAIGARQVVLTRAEKIDGTPAVPSRWLLRLDALIGAPDPGKQDTGSPWLAWHRQLDTPERVVPVSPPAPRPDVDDRPTALYVTAVQTWMRDPYAIFARRILGLRPLDDIDARPGAAERGTFIHEALDQFMRENGPRTGEAGYDRLIEEGRVAFGDTMAQPTVWAFWWPRFEKVARWFIENEAARAGRFTVAATEVKGRYAMTDVTRSFTVMAKADRIDLGPDGGLTIIDYKTGSPPKARQIKAGFAPQLPLEGLIAMAGGFDGLEIADVDGLEFWQLRGGSPVATEMKVKNAEEEIENAEAGMRRLVNAFAKPGTPYLSNPRPAEAGYGDYDHLARNREWINAGDDPEGDGT